MKLRHLRIESCSSGGGLFDGLEVSFGRNNNVELNEAFSPLCLIGPNGSGKSQFLQLLAEIFQSVWHLHSPDEERVSANDDILFELTYFISPEEDEKFELVKLVRTKRGQRNGPIELYLENRKEPLNPKEKEFGKYLPSIIIGYTSGDNETLSLPFLVSRSGYAKDVREAALKNPFGSKVLDNRLMLVDYGTNLEVLFSNMMLGEDNVREAILEHAALNDMASCRCIIQLAHSAVTYKALSEQSVLTGRKKIQLTQELEETIINLKRTATCWHENKATETYTFDFYVDKESRKAIKHFWNNSLLLYKSLHKFSLLNDLVIKKEARDRMKKAVTERRFAARLPEPLQEDLVFRFEEVRFWPKGDKKPVDYVSLSDGEHQQALILGVYAMISEGKALFLLDEPESHFNPQWRVKFVQRLLELKGNRTAQEFLLTSHAPFVPSDMQREQILIFSRHGDKIITKEPDIETFGATFDKILESCFNITPPISRIAKEKINELLHSDNIEEIEQVLGELGQSVEKAFLANHLRLLKKK